MNANELLNLGNELTRLSSDYLAQKCVDDNDVQNYIYRSMDILERTRIRVTAEEKPTEEKEYKQGALFMVMAFDRELGYWEKHTLQYINDDASRCPYWFPLPQLPEVTP